MEWHQLEAQPHFKKWFPRPVPKDVSSDPLIRIFCFHGAGMDFTVWTTLGSPRAPMPNSLASLCAKENIQMLAAQLPGRGVRSKEVLPPSVQACATEILDVVESLICSTVPYILIGYSMGCWIAYELCCAIDQRRRDNTRIRLPDRVIFASMVSPDIPQPKRPWSMTATLSTEEFQRELRGWSCNEVLFQPDLWKTYEPMLRNDHKLLDDYVCTLPDKPLNVPCTVFRARGDLKLQDDTLFAGWFSLFAKDHHPAQEPASSSPETRSRDTSAEDSGNLSEEDSLTQDITNTASEITEGMANLRINGKGSSSETETHQSRCNLLAKQKLSTFPEVSARTETTEKVPCFSSSNAGEQLERPACPSTKSRAEAEHKNQTSHSSVKLLEGNHGLMYDPQHRNQFFEELEKILERHMLDITYNGA